jgi:DNA polymerase-1
VKNRQLLIDGDVVLYINSIAVETEFDWGDDVWTLHSDLQTAKQLTKVWMDSLEEDLNASAPSVVAFSDKLNFRKQILPTYKYHRKKHRKPLAFKPLKKYMEETWESKSLKWCEADDVLGILQTDPAMAVNETVIVTIDKDLRTIPGLHYNPMKPDEGVVEVTKEQAMYNHLYQTLTGDSVDGFKGCPGIGPVRAKRILNSDCSWETVVKSYGGAGMDEGAAMIQAQVARILHHTEYNYKKEEVLLWSPSSTATTC